ncbi:hypothetical protein RQP54_02205 [Curvibacter sp. APW13]|uniref:hypothetical protein n=1 Tax=Curvibacter sp. APW13 TaxID=3077236 RepID=UPI0028DDF1ED|nr:hypothetical protein [Curvibacter sp. APW13]MDT8989671.1 hypothetical protein [Curvibacter sp. APW13]
MQHTTSARPPRRNLGAVATYFIAAYAIFVRANGHFDHQRWARHARNALLTLGLLSSLQVGAEGVGASPGWAGFVWQEQVLLHDGQTLLVQRAVRRGGRHEVGQKGDYVAQSLQFTVPRTGQTIVWEDNATDDLRNSSFLPMALELVGGTPYLVANTMGCLAYNKWGRPNPPYVVFRYQGAKWERIALSDLPAEVSTPNLVQSMPDLVAEKEPGRVVTAQRIAQIVAEYRQPEYRSILREPINYDPECIPMVTNGKGLWLSEGWFRRKSSLQACLNGCKDESFGDDTCPCKQFFQAD